MFLYIILCAKCCMEHFTHSVLILTATNLIPTNLRKGGKETGKEENLSFRKHESLPKVK